ncbi:hypothetical protein [Bdellovibrio bacteriovorus]|uniref:Outer membrane protein beta-barrel domain-containing protein n=1 Tax=Bdellovibrio bacteriovorus str. Tiberius TaxID=1069642 RepID=K7YUV9_BDEBC|nr:hypothetical protein [Bdellovibrio bacteriovorus]AFY00440.1 Hypothetical protein Bdt_0733 [Bdellovibrio bacteriovorus str. Tiberius]
MNSAILIFAMTLLFAAQNSSAQEADKNQATSTEAAETPKTSAYTIKQVIPSQNLVVAETSNSLETLSPGKTFLVTFPNNKQCSLILKGKKDSLLTLSSKECLNREEITKDLPIELALIEEESNSQHTPSTPQVAMDELPSSLEERWASGPRLGFSVYYASANQANFEDVYATTSSGSGNLNAEFGTDSSVGIGLTFARMKPQNWGISTSLLLEVGRKINTIKFTGSGGTASGNFTGTKPKLSFLIGEAGLAYRWNTFYIPFGLNLSIPTLTDTDGSSVEIYGGLGAYFGAGVLLTENSSIDFIIRSVALNMTQTSGTSSIDYGRGSMTGFSLGYKYWF